MQGPESSSNDKKITRRSLEDYSKKATIVLISVLISIGTLLGVYIIGYNNGIKNQKDNVGKVVNKPKDPIENMPDMVKNRWSIVGTVESVSVSSITVKNNKGLVQTASINDKSSVTDNTTNKTTVSAIKKGSSVIVVGTKDDNGKYTASMIRIKLGLITIIVLNMRTVLR